MRNAEIRDAAKTAGVFLWEIAERFGVSDCNFSRKLRKELPDSERERVLTIIKELAAERQEVI